MTQATQYMPMDHLQRFASLYDLQELFGRSQDLVVEFVVDVGTLADSAPERIPRLVFGRLNTAVEIHRVLEAVYDSTLL